MSRDRGNGEGAPRAESSPTVYCIVPSELAELREPLSRHFVDDPSVEVVVERRREDRRSERDRRESTAPPRPDARRAAGRRRSADRRSALLRVQEQVSLPPEVAPYADQLAFVERVRSVPQRIVDRVRRLASAQASATHWRQRSRESEREANELMRALVGVAEDLREMRSMSPRWFAALNRAEQAIERYRQRRT